MHHGTNVVPGVSVPVAVQVADLGAPAGHQIGEREQRRTHRLAGSKLADPARHLGDLIFNGRPRHGQK